MPPKKTAPVTDPARAFERLRQRAATIDTPTVPDFVLGPDDGFDPEIRVRLPLSVRAQEAFYYAARSGDVFAQMRAVLGPDQYDRVLTALEGEKDSADLFVGFSRMLLDHLSGKGAGDVEGGSGQS